MELTRPQEKFLRSLAHDRKPIIWLGQHGLTDKVLVEIETALDYHELIKIKLRVGNRELRDQTIVDICARTRAAAVQRIGNIVAIYRKNRQNPGIILPK
jgi:RNA-binding protein